MMNTHTQTHTHTARTRRPATHAGARRAAVHLDNARAAGGFSGRRWRPANRCSAAAAMRTRRRVDPLEEVALEPHEELVQQPVRKGRLQTHTRMHAARAPIITRPPTVPQPPTHPPTTSPPAHQVLRRRRTFGTVPTAAASCRWTTGIRASAAACTPPASNSCTCLCAA